MNANYLYMLINQGGIIKMTDLNFEDFKVKLFDHISNSMFDTRDVVKYAGKEKDKEARALLKDVESAFPNLEGITQLMDIDSNVFNVGQNLYKLYEPIIEKFPQLKKQLVRFTEINNPDLALIITGFKENRFHAGTAEDVLEKGYTPVVFEGQLASYQGILTDPDFNISLGNDFYCPPCF